MTFDPYLVVAEIIVKLFGRPKISLGPGGVKFEIVQPQDEETLDKRLAKIDVARESLTDALAAMDELKTAAQQNQRDLERVLGAIAQAHAHKQDADAQLSAAKSVAAIEARAVRKALGIPTAVDIWRERLIAFSFGVASSVLATMAWEFLLKPHLGS